MCHILMDDSHWLDSFQASALSGEVKTKDPELAASNCFLPQAIAAQSKSNNIPWESGHSVELHFNRSKSIQNDGESKDILTGRGLQRSKSTDSLNSTNFGRRIITAPMSVVAQLPAPEFVVGANSGIAAESMRMIAAAGSLHWSGSLGNACAADGLRDPCLPPGISYEQIAQGALD